MAYCIDLLTVASELLIISLDLVKNRIGVMSTDMRRNFIQVVLTQLIEKSPDAKVMKTVVKMVEEWVKAKVRFVSRCSCLLLTFRGNYLRVYSPTCLTMSE